MILSSMPNLKMVSSAAESKVAEAKKECNCGNTTFDFAAELEKAKKAFSADAASSAIMLTMDMFKGDSGGNSFATLSTQAIKTQIQQSLKDLQDLGVAGLQSTSTVTNYGKGYNLSLIRSEDES